MDLISHPLTHVSWLGHASADYTSGLGRCRRGGKRREEEEERRGQCYIQLISLVRHSLQAEKQMWLPTHTHTHTHTEKSVFKV